MIRIFKCLDDRDQTQTIPILFLFCDETPDQTVVESFYASLRMSINQKMSTNRVRQSGGKIVKKIRMRGKKAGPKLELDLRSKQVLTNWFSEDGAEEANKERQQRHSCPPA